MHLAAEHDLAAMNAINAANFGVTLLERGNCEEAAAVVDSAALTPLLIEGITGIFLLEARGRICLARGRHGQAIADLRRCGQLADHARLHNSNGLAWRSVLALALAPEHVHEARELAQAELEQARHANLPRAIGIALRVCGLLADPQDRIELLEQSVTVLEPTPMQLELAHSLTELGAALRRTGARVAAREPLRRALDLAQRCGATPLAKRARDEALAAGARPRRPWTTGVHDLTPSELRVAQLATQPLSNRDIAQALFITAKTVSDHLSSAYRKIQHLLPRRTCHRYDKPCATRNAVSTGRAGRKCRQVRSNHMPAQPVVRIKVRAEMSWNGESRPAASVPARPPTA